MKNLFLLLLVLSFGASLASGAAYTRQVNISNNISSSVNDVWIVLNGSGGFDTASLIASNKLQADCRDLEINYSGRPVSYFFASSNGYPGGCNSAKSQIWFFSNISGALDQNIVIGYGGTSQYSYINPNGELLFLAFENSSQNNIVIDSTGKGNGSGINVSKWVFSDSVVGGSYNLTTPGEAISFGDTTRYDGLQSFSLNSWIYISSTSSLGSWFNKDTSGTTGSFRLDLNSQKPEGYFYDGANYIGLGGVEAIPLNSWHFLSYVVNASKNTVRLDGKYIYNGTQSPFNGIQNSGYSLVIGAQAGGSNYFQGRLDNLLSVNHALNRDQEEWYYQTGRTPLALVSDEVLVTTTTTTSTTTTSTTTTSTTTTSTTTTSTTTTTEETTTTVSPTTTTTVSPTTTTTVSPTTTTTLLKCFNGSVNPDGIGQQFMEVWGCKVHDVVIQDMNGSSKTSGLVTLGIGVFSFLFVVVLIGVPVVLGIFILSKFGGRS